MRLLTAPTDRTDARGRWQALAALLLAVGLLLPLAPPAADAQQGPRAPDQPRDDIPVRRLAGGDRIATAVAVSASAFTTAEVALVARADDFADALVAGPLAAQRQAPILLTARDRLSPATAAELDRLGVREVLVLGGPGAVDDGVVADLEAAGYDVDRIAGDSRHATAAAAAEALETDGRTVYVATGDAFPDALAAGPVAARAGMPILLVTRDAVPAATDRALRALEPERIVVLGGAGAIGEAVVERLDAIAATTRIAGRTRYETAAAVFDLAVQEGADADDLWVADGRDFPDALVAGPVIGARGGALLLVDGSHLAAAEPPYRRIRDRALTLDRVTLLGGSAPINADAAEQLQGVAFGAELPRGGRLLFPRHRMVALYGNARSDRLGILGEQTPEQAADMAERFAAPYGADGKRALPAFELIVTVAQRDAGPDGLYRRRADPDEIPTYLEVARANDLYLFIDIQPGRSDFLTEVRFYERWLAEPDVGVALDPEWRMGPNERPGDSVGTVDAAEVNEVVDYLADIVRRNRLPQKLLVIHQFQDRMITNRDRIRTPDELSVNFHADGFGGRAAKRSKYESFLAPRPYSMGFKLFLDEDTDLFQPADILGFRVPPDLVTYQ
jgi:putative cell wall-binding protein